MYCPRCKTYISPNNDVENCPHCGLDITREKEFVYKTLPEIWFSEEQIDQIFVIRSLILLGLLFTGVQVLMTYTYVIGIVFWLVSYIPTCICLNRGLDLCKNIYPPERLINFKAKYYIYSFAMGITFIGACVMLLAEQYFTRTIDLNAPADLIHNIYDLGSPELLSSPNTYCFLITVVMFMFLISTYRTLHKLVMEHLNKIYE